MSQEAKTSSCFEYFAHILRLTVECSVIFFFFGISHNAGIGTGSFKGPLGRPQPTVIQANFIHSDLLGSLCSPGLLLNGVAACLTEDPGSM